MEEGHITMEAEIAVMQLSYKAKNIMDSQKLPEAGKDKKQILSQSLQKEPALLTT